MSGENEKEYIPENSIEFPEDFPGKYIDKAKKSVGPISPGGDSQPPTGGSGVGPIPAEGEQDESVTEEEDTGENDSD